MALEPNAFVNFVIDGGLSITSVVSKFLDGEEVDHGLGGLVVPLPCWVGIPAAEVYERVKGVAVL